MNGLVSKLTREYALNVNPLTGIDREKRGMCLYQVQGVITNEEAHEKFPRLSILTIIASFITYPVG